MKIVILIGCIFSLLIYKSESYVHLLPLLSQVFGFGIFSCLEMLRAQNSLSEKIMIYTFLALNISNLLIYITGVDWYFNISLMILVLGFFVAEIAGRVK